MTITANDRRKDYVANGATTTFNGPRAFDNAHVVVLLGVVDAYVVVPKNQYVVRGLGTASTTIKFTVAPAAGLKVRILRTVPLDQPTDITNQGAFLPEIHEDAFDYRVMQLQQLADGSLVEVLDPDSGEFVWDAKGQRIINVGDPKADQDAVNKRSGGGGGGGGDSKLRADLASVEPGKGASLVGFVQEADGTVPRTVMDKLRETVALADFDGAIPDGDSTVAIAAAEASDFPFIDLGGNTYHTTAAANSLTKHYFNGKLFAVAWGTGQELKNRPPIRDTELTAKRTKSPIYDWAGKRVLWLGTSIPHQGAGVDSYPDLACGALGATVVNNAWSQSAMGYDPDGDPFAIGTVMRLSMTEDDRLAGLAAHGPSSAYSDTFDPITKASQMTCNFRIAQPIAASYFDAVVIDHAHNDVPAELGVPYVETLEIVSVTKGSPTQITVADVGSLQVGDAVQLRFGNGWAGMDYLSRRIDAISGKTITLKFNSTSVAGSLVSGTVNKIDRTTIHGAWAFIIGTVRHNSMFFHAKMPAIILAGAPSEYTYNQWSPDIYGVAQKVLAVAEHWGLAFFDAAYYMGVSLFDHKAYFPDDVHPTTRSSRQVIANYWAKWFSGGEVPVLNTAGLVKKLPAAVFPDSYPLAWDMYSESVVAPATLVDPTNYLVSTASLADASNVSGAGYSTNGAVSYGASPGGGANSLATSTSSGGYIHQDFGVRATVIRTKFNLYIPEGPLTTSAIAIATIAGWYRGLDAPNIVIELYAYNNGLPPNIGVAFFDASNNYVQVPARTTSRLTPGWHSIELVAKKNYSLGVGGCILYVDGVRASDYMPYNNRTLGLDRRFQLGRIFSSDFNNVDIRFRNLEVKQNLQYSVITTQADVAGSRVVNGMIVSSSGG